MQASNGKKQVIELYGDDIGEESITAHGKTTKASETDRARLSARPTVLLSSKQFI